MTISDGRAPGTAKKRVRMSAAVLVAFCLAEPAHADDPRAPLGGVASRLGCSSRAHANCAGDFCYDSTRSEASGTTSVGGPSAWAFEFDFKNRTASVGEGYAKDRNRRWPMQALEESPAVVNKPMFVKFSLRTDTQKLFVMIVATPLPEAQGYSFAYGVVSRGPYGRKALTGQALPGIDKTIDSGKCMVE